MSTSSVVWRCDACQKKNRIRIERWSQEPTCGSCGALLQTNHPQEIQGPTDFKQRVEESGLPVLVDFWAPWCGPCHMVAPALKSIAKEFEGKLVVMKVNTDENKAISAQFKISSIPTLMIYKNGQVAERIAGAMPEPRLRQWVQSHL